MNCKALKKTFSFLLIIVFSVSASLAQIDVGIGQWRIHLPYNGVYSIAETPVYLYVGAERGFYRFHKQSGETEIFSKVNGFSDVEVAKLKYHEGLDLLLIAYENTNLDILKDNRIYNISDILRKSIPGVKKIYDIEFQGNLAYLSCSFGIVIVDLEERRVKDSYLNIGPNGTTIPINSLAFFRDSIYIASEGGVYAAYKNNPVLSDYNNWHVTKASFRPTVRNSNHLRVFADTLYVNIDRIFYMYDGVNWKLFDGGQIPQEEDTRSVEITHNQLVVAQMGKISIVQADGSRREVVENVLNFAIVDFQNNIWTGGDLTGLEKISPSGQYSYVRPNGPQGASAFEMMEFMGSIYVAGGGVTPARQPAFNNSGYYVFDGSRWLARPNDSRLEGTFDFITLAGNESTRDVFIGSHGWGLLQLRDGQVVDIFNENNSSLQKSQGGFLQVDGLAFDKDQNLWISNYDADNSLSVRTKNGTWKSFTMPSTRAGELVIDAAGQKWITAPKESNVGIMVFKELDGPLGQSQTIRVLTNSPKNGNLPSNDVTALCIDQDGEIWVGTEEGLCIFSFPQNVLEGGTQADAQRIIIDDGQDVGYLLGNEVINDIKIDGANRKWVATNTGAWLIAADGSSVIVHYTKDNSPLISNTVNCIGIMPTTGEVFFGTDKGIVSTRGDATAGSDVHGDVVVFPNPVRPDYKGPITITGLPESATVKITDVAGQVVYEMVSNGGTAVWDGNNFNGERAKSGIYLFITANKDDEDVHVSKLLLIN
ncbi:MAG: hypothetical protein GC181_09230 [Bacteroidetes bacterium]|nr:hypothetical protein [Bacteroidota bacterium]